MAETCRERLMRENPSQVNDDYIGGCNGCPMEYGYLYAPADCAATEAVCRRCWDRVIPETFEEKLAAIPEVEPDEIDLQMIAMAEQEKEKEKNMTGTKETQCTRCIHREVCSFKKDFLEIQECIDKALYKDGTRICDIPFIYPVELKCKYFYHEPVEPVTHAYASTSATSATAYNPDIPSTHTY